MLPHTALPVKIIEPLVRTDRSISSRRRVVRKDLRETDPKVSVRASVKEMTELKADSREMIADLQITEVNKTVREAALSREAETALISRADVRVASLIRKTDSRMRPERNSSPSLSFAVRP